MATKRIAVDFDGTIAKTRFPFIVEPLPEAIYLRKWQKAGHKILLWTNRTDDALYAAIEWCQTELGITFDEVCRLHKPDCDYFIDDKFVIPVAEQWRLLNQKLGGR